MVLIASCSGELVGEAGVRAAIFAVGILVAAVVVGALLVDEGEVATLSTRDAEGRHFDTQVWLVELDDALFLRSNSPDSEWLARVRERPEVELTRGDETAAWRSAPQSDPDLRRRVNEAMARKYGTSDRLLCWVLDKQAMVPVLLEPAPGGGAH